MNDNHAEEFEDLFAAYAMFGFVPVDAWATADLVSLSRLIDIELQQRAEDEASAVR